MVWSKWVIGKSIKAKSRHPLKMSKKFVLTIAYLISAVFFCSIQVAAEATLFPISQNEKGGYIDQTGKIVIEPQFDRASEFSEGLAAVLMDGVCGYIDQAGKMVIEPRFISCEDFSEGLAVIRTRMGAYSYGYINKNGEVVIPAQFDDARQFSEGLAYVAITTGYPKEGYIDKTGEFVIQLKPETGGFDFADFSEGLAPIIINEQFGYIDQTGKVVIKANFDMVDSFSDGLANVGWRLPGVDVDAINKAGYIDRTGNLVIEPKFYYSPNLTFFSEGLAIAMDQNRGKVGSIDKTGKFVIEPQFDNALPFSAGLAPVFIADPDSRPGELKKGKWGYINQTGRFVIEPTFGPYDIMHLYDSEYLGKFTNELAKINIGIYQRVDTEEEWTATQKWGYINKTGHFVWQGEERNTYKKSQ